MSQDNFADIIPYGDLGIIALESSRAIGEKVDNYVSSWRNESRNDEESIHFTSYKKDSYLIDAVCPRFGSGESKGPFAVKICTFYWMYVITALLTRFVDKSITCPQTIIIRI